MKIEIDPQLLPKFKSPSIILWGLVAWSVWQYLSLNGVRAQLGNIGPLVNQIYQGLSKQQETS